MARIEQPEIDAVEQFVTDDMIIDAADVIGAHHASSISLFTGNVTCSCGVTFEDALEWRDHVAKFIVVRHTALMARAAKKENCRKEVMPV